MNIGGKENNMKKDRLFISSIISLLALSSLIGCGSNHNDTINDEYNIIWDSSVHLDGGDIVSNDVHFHFDERSVNETPSDCFVEIGAYGALYLTSYVPGIAKVRVDAVITTEYIGEFILGQSATPNNVEHFNLYSSTYDFIDVTSDTPYFSIHNRADNVLKIKSVSILYEKPETDNDAVLRQLLKLDDIETTYDKDHPVRPYDQNKSLEVPANRIIEHIGPEEYTEPGEYKIGYEVYTKNDDGTRKKLLFSVTSMLKIHGTANDKHLAIFHLEDKNIILEVPAYGQVYITNNKELCVYNWENSFNDFVNPMLKDRDFYPTYNAVGVPSAKNGDGCYPVSARFTALDKVVIMPDPTTKPGYKFAGWYMDHDCTKPFDPLGRYNSNLTLYAKCIEETRSFRKVYYYDYDDTFLNRVDLLYDDQDLTLPTFEEVGSTLPDYAGVSKMYALSSGANRVAMLRPEGDYPSWIQEGATDHYDGDKLTNELASKVPGDIKLTVSRYELYENGPAAFTRVFEDSEENYAISGFKSDDTVHDGDRILSGRYIFYNSEKERYDYDVYGDPTWGGDYLICDAVYGNIMDQGSYTSISTHAYANMHKDHAKPLEGILRHESVLKVSRRAFFNRYGMKGTYFPRNARTFEIESYANTMFTGILQLPKSLTKIGKRAFMGSENIQCVMLPKSLTTVEEGAFSLGTFDEETMSFTNIRARSEEKDKITFYYEGNSEEFNKLDEATRNEITSNGKVIYNATYNVYYGK